MKTITAIFTSFFFLSTFTAPLTASASPYSIDVNTQPPEEAVSPLEEGQAAPFDGVLYSTAAAAKVQVELETHEQQCKLKVDEEVAKTEAKLTLDLANMRASKVAAETKYRDVTEIKNAQIEFLTQEMTKQEKRNGNRWAPLYIGGGVLGGILIMIAAGYAMGQIQK